MEVSWAVMADFANVDAASKMNIIGAFQEITPLTFPFELSSMYLAVAYEASPVEVGANKRIKLTLLDSDAKENLYNQELDITIQPGPGAVPGRPVTIQLVLGLSGLIFKKPGDYAFHLLVNGETKKSLSLRVNEPRQIT